MPSKAFFANLILLGCQLTIFLMTNPFSSFSRFPSSPFATFTLSYSKFLNTLPSTVCQTIFLNISQSLIIKSPISGLSASQAFGYVKMQISPQIMLVRVTVGAKSYRTRGRQTFPLQLMFGWQSRLRQLSFGGSIGQLSGNYKRNRTRQWEQIEFYWAVIYTWIVCRLSSWGKDKSTKEIYSCLYWARSFCSLKLAIVFLPFWPSFCPEELDYCDFFLNNILQSDLQFNLHTQNQSSKQIIQILRKISYKIIYYCS